MRQIISCNRRGKFQLVLSGLGSRLRNKVSYHQWSLIPRSHVLRTAVGTPGKRFHMPTIEGVERVCVLFESHTCMAYLMIDIPTPFLRLLLRIDPFPQQPTHGLGSRSLSPPGDGCPLTTDLLVL